MSKKNGAGRRDLAAVPRASCHDGNSAILTRGEGVLYIGGLSRGVDFEGGLLIIDMTEGGDAQPNLLITGNRLGMAALPIAAYEKQPWVNIPTPDMKTPPLSAAAWKRIALDLGNWLDGGHSAVIVCYGGHGRSGLAGAILLHLLDPQSGCPVERVRELHCQHAVETQGQLDYVARILGVKVTARPDSRKAAQRLWSKADYDDPDTPPILAHSQRAIDWSWGRLCSVCTEPTGNLSGLCDDCERQEASPRW
jgi:hypothetical protein